MEPPLSGPLLSGPLLSGTVSIVRTAQIGHVACSLLTIMKFGLDKSTRRNLKVAVYLFGVLFILLLITTTWLLGDNAFLQPRGVTMNAL